MSALKSVSLKVLGLLSCELLGKPVCQEGWSFNLHTDVFLGMKSKA